MLKIICDPRILNYVIMGLFLVNAVRWAFEKNWMASLYWLSSFTITVAVTYK